MSCSSLASVTLPKDLKQIGDGAFYGCKNLTSITIPKNVKEIEESAFRDCENLTSVTICEGVTEIGNCAFADCAAFTSIEIPDSVECIGKDAFEKSVVNHDKTPCGLKTLYLGPKSLLSDETLRDFCGLPEDCKIIRKTK